VFPTPRQPLPKKWVSLDFSSSRYHLVSRLTLIPWFPCNSIVCTTPELTSLGYQLPLWPSASPSGLLTLLIFERAMIILLVALFHWWKLVLLAPEVVSRKENFNDSILEVPLWSD
jgi:hypothetical protein